MLHRLLLLTNNDKMQPVKLQKREKEILKSCDAGMLG